MKYKELRKWFIEWLNIQSEPVPLNVGNYLLSKDIRTKIKNDIERIDLSLSKGKPTKQDRILLLHLNKIKEAIENKSHDITGYGWTVFDKWIENN